MNDQTTKAQQEFIDAVTDAENDTKYRSISPGVCSGCSECLSSFGYEDDDPEDEQFTDPEHEDYSPYYEPLTAEQKAHDDLETGKWCDEGGFSWHSCDCCGSGLGGDRYAAHGHDDNGEIIHYDICSDCLFYLANGDLPERPYE